MRTKKLIYVPLILIILVGYVVARNHLKQQSQFASSMKEPLDTKRSLDKTTFENFLKAQEFNVRIACIGNSITQGSHLEDPKKDCYPAQLGRILNEIYGDTCIVNNYGLSGRNMLKNGPNPIWKETKFHQAIDWEPDICFILLGTNDSRPDLWKNSGNEFLSDYLAMIDTFKTRNPNTKFIIGAPTPIWKGHRYGGDTWGEKHNDSIMVNGVIPSIKMVSEKTGALLIDFHKPFEDSGYLFPDHLHPNPTGASRIAKMILETIENKDMIHAIVKNKANQ